MTWAHPYPLTTNKSDDETKKKKRKEKKGVQQTSRLVYKAESVTKGFPGLICRESIQSKITRQAHKKVR